MSWRCATKASHVAADWASTKLRAGRRPVLARASLSRCSDQRVRDEWQGEPEYRATGFLVLYPYPSAVSFDDGPCDGKPHPHAGCFGGKERLEYLLRLLSWNARSFSLYGYLCARARP